MPSAPCPSLLLFLVVLLALPLITSVPLSPAVRRRAVFRFQRGLKRKPLALIKKLRKAKKEAASGEKPEAVRTHLRNMIIVPEMIGSVIGVYNGKTFNQVRLGGSSHGSRERW